jgi:hypothetical protein
MMSRMTLSLRSQAMGSQGISDDGPLIANAGTAAAASEIAFGPRAVDNLKLNLTARQSLITPSWDRQSADPFAHTPTSETTYSCERSGDILEGGGGERRQHLPRGIKYSATGTAEDFEGSGGNFELRHFKRRSWQIGKDDGDNLLGRDPAKVTRSLPDRGEA